jgi:hypothetical protein
MRENRNAYSILELKPVGKRTLGGSRRRWNNIKMDLREIGWVGVDFIDLAQDTVGSSVEHGNEPSTSITFWEVFK